MSKRLEEEYRTMIEGEVPDLWSRIESGLKDKAADPLKESSANPPADSKENSRTVTPPKKKKPVIFKILPWAGGIAVAAIIFIAVVPVLFYIVGGRSMMKNATQTLGPTAAAQENVMYDAAPADSMPGSDAYMAEAVNAEEELAGAKGEAMDRGKQTDGAATNQYKAMAGLKETEATEEETLYFLVCETKTEGNTVYVRGICRDNPDAVKNETKDASEEMTSFLEISKDSGEEPETGVIYIVKWNGEALELIERAE